LAYFDVLDAIHLHLLPRTYLEIGVSTGTSMTLATPGTRCVGVDPEPRVPAAIRRRVRVYPTTSDDFFREQSPAAVLGGQPLDLVFIDGLHLFEAALRDFVNVEAWSNPDTTVLIHDCYPANEVGAARERSTAGWSGDVWKLICVLKEWRPDLQVTVVDAAPTGLGIVRGLDPASHVLADNFSTIVDSYTALPYSYLEDNGGKAAVLNAIPNDWSRVRDLLPATPFRHASRALARTGRFAWPDRWSFSTSRLVYRARRSAARLRRA